MVMSPHRVPATAPAWNWTPRSRRSNHEQIQLADVQTLFEIEWIRMPHPADQDF